MSVKAQKKLFVLTNKQMFDAFKKMIVGLPIKDIELRLVRLKNSQYEVMPSS
jgi:hypothetical protein